MNAGHFRLYGLVNKVEQEKLTGYYRKQTRQLREEGDGEPL